MIIYYLWVGVNKYSMKLLSMRLCEHDSNMCFFDGKNVHYFKAERKYQIKNHAYDDLWSWKSEIKSIFDVDYKNIDEIVIIIDPWRHNLPTDNEDFFPTIEYEYFPFDGNVYRINHHYAHALSGWMMLDRDPDVSIVIDGFGDKNKTWSVFKNNSLVEEGLMNANGSIGCEMANLGNWLGVSTINDCEISGKTMGLQSYGRVDYDFYRSLKKFDIYSINEIFNLQNWIDHKKDQTLARLSPLDFARTVHEYVGEVLVDFFSKHAKKDDLIFYSGGVAQNVIWNTRLKKMFPNLIIPPHCADEGLSLGGIEWLRRKNNLSRYSLKDFPYIQKDQAPYTAPSQETIYKTAKFLNEGKLIGWYQGNGEIGPRALGNRSILVNPLLSNAKEITNKVKNRENYRPFGAVVLEEYKQKFFKDFNYSNPYMLFVAEVLDNSLQSITHIDKTCRIQTLKDENVSLRSLMLEFYKISKCPVLLNTSLNLAGKPIVGSIDDAKELFYSSRLDILVIGDEIFQK